MSALPHRSADTSAMLTFHGREANCHLIISDRAASWCVLRSFSGRAVPYVSEGSCRIEHVAALVVRARPAAGHR